MSDAAFERGFVAGWEARGRRDEAVAVEDELRLRREAEEARMRSEKMRQQAAQQQGQQLTEAEWAQVGGRPQGRVVPAAEWQAKWMPR